MNILVTGGSGFIGSNVVEILRQRGDAVMNFDLKRPSFAGHDPHWRQGDLLNLDQLNAAFDAAKPDAVIHLAAHAEIYSTDWEDFASIHRGTENLLSAIDSYGRLKRLVNVSTQLVIAPGYRPRSLLDFRPYSVYGEAKAYAEAVLLQWRSPVAWVTVRPANIWGPRHPAFADAIWKYIERRVYLHPITRRPVERSYGYVRNTAQQMVALMAADLELTNRQVFYLADEVMDSALWVDAFADALTGKPARRVNLSVLRAMGFLGDVAARAGRRIPIDSGRVGRMTESYPVPLDRTLAVAGPPRISFDEGVRETVEWLRAYRSGAQPA